MKVCKKVNISVLFFGETFRSFLVETFWSLKHLGRLSHSCIKTCHISVFLAYIFKHSDRNDLIFFGHFKNSAVYDRKKQVHFLRLYFFKYMIILLSLRQYSFSI